LTFFANGSLKLLLYLTSSRCAVFKEQCFFQVLSLG